MILIIKTEEEEITVEDVASFTVNGRKLLAEKITGTEIYSEVEEVEAKLIGEVSRKIKKLREEIQLGE